MKGVLIRDSALLYHGVRKKLYLSLLRCFLVRPISSVRNHSAHEHLFFFGYIQPYRCSQVQNEHTVSWLTVREVQYLVKLAGGKFQSLLTMPCQRLSLSSHLLGFKSHRGRKRPCDQDSWNRLEAWNGDTSTFKVLTQSLTHAFLEKDTKRILLYVLVSWLLRIVNVISQKRWNFTHFHIPVTKRTNRFIKRGFSTLSYLYTFAQFPWYTQHHDRWSVLNLMASISLNAAVHWCRSSPPFATFDCVSASNNRCGPQQSAVSRASGSGCCFFKRADPNWRVRCLVSYEAWKDNALTDHSSEEREEEGKGAEREALVYSTSQILGHFSVVHENEAKFIVEHPRKSLHLE